MCLANLEFDYTNPYDSTSQINKVVMPKFITQGVSCFLYLITRWRTLVYVTIEYSIPVLQCEIVSLVLPYHRFFFDPLFRTDNKMLLSTKVIFYCEKK
ncbi:hypothetical protein ACSBR2_003872 [Camellia fascicularis]